LSAPNEAFAKRARRWEVKAVPIGRAGILNALGRIQWPLGANPLRAFTNEETSSARYRLLLNEIPIAWKHNFSWLKNSEVRHFSCDNDSNAPFNSGVRSSGLAATRMASVVNAVIASVSGLENSSCRR